MTRNNLRLRTALFVPGDNARAMAKAPTLKADARIYDLEDGVAPEKKLEARDAVLAALQNPLGESLIIVRINEVHSEQGEGDLAALAAFGPDALMLPKVHNLKVVEDAVSQLDAHGLEDMALWCNIETPEGVVNVEAIAAHPRVEALVVGTNDLVNDLRCEAHETRKPLLYALSRVVMAARAYNKVALDGTFVRLKETRALMREARQGRMLGFDGKTLIHPSQIDPVNRVFTPSRQEVREAKDIIEAYEKAMKEERAVTILQGRMIERLHYTRAQEVLTKHRAA